MSAPLPHYPSFPLPPSGSFSHSQTSFSEDSILSYFAEELKRLRMSSDIDVSDAWNEHERDLAPQTSTLPLLLRHQKEVVTRLLRSLRPRNITRADGAHVLAKGLPINFARGVHRLLLILARDLRQEFYVTSFKPVLRVLVKSVDTRTSTICLQFHYCHKIFQFILNPRQ